MTEQEKKTVHPPGEVLARWHAFIGRKTHPVTVGNINATFIVDAADGPAIIQRLHPVFEASVNLDIDAITRHLADKGMKTPKVIPTDDGQLWVGTDEGPWRALTFVEGKNVEKVDSPNLAKEAGALVGRFHTALDDLEHDFHFSRGNVHDTARHLAHLERAVDEKKAHRLFDEVARLADAVLKDAARLPDLSALPERYAHGDLKISNLMFDEEGRGLCLIDLDTLSKMVWPFEMGDALRSWCNPRPEDVRPANFELDLFEAAIEGYASTALDLVSVEEKRHLVDGLSTISLELSARFLADALFETYFGYDEEKYETRGDANLARGRAMLELHQSVEQKRKDAEALVKRLLG